MAGKRKRKSNNWYRPKKRPKQAEFSWQIKDIIDERTLASGEKEYRVDWADHPETGESYSPEWKPEVDVTEGALAAWEEIKRTRTGQIEPDQFRPAYPEREAETTEPYTIEPVPGLPLPLPLSAGDLLPAAAPVPSARRLTAGIPFADSPRVEVEARNTSSLQSFNLVQHISTSPESLGLVAPRNWLSSSQSSSSYSGSRNYRVTKQVPDSEEEDLGPEASYEPQSHNITTSASTVESAPDSAPLDSIQYPTSPALSIAEPALELELDSIEDSQLDGQSAHTQQRAQVQDEDEREIPDTFDTVLSTSQVASLDAPGQSDQTLLQEEPAENSVEIPVKEGGSKEQLINIGSIAEAPRLDPQQLVHNDTQFEVQQSLRLETQTEPLHQEARRKSQLEAQAEHQPEVQQEVQPEVQQEVQSEVQQEVQSEVQQEVQPEVQQEVQPEAQQEVQPEAQQEVQPLGQPNTQQTAQPEEEQGVQPETIPLSSSEQGLECQRPQQSGRLFLTPQPNFESSIQQRDFAIFANHADTLVPTSLVNSQPSSSEQQHAQVVERHYTASSQVQSKLSSSLQELPQGTQIGSVRPTVEREISPQSRHDSSQESPNLSATNSSSPIFRPPEQPFKILEVTARAPSRPQTPVSFPSTQEIMSGSGSTQEKFQKVLEQARRANPFTPTLKIKRPSSLSGTRSPSTIPDRSPITQVPTSLRTVTTPKPVTVPTEEGPSEPGMPVNEGETGSDNSMAATAPVTSSSASDERMSDADIDVDGSILNDDVPLHTQEYIVPLPIDGRQSSSYRNLVKDNRDLLKAFIEDPQGYEQIAEVENILHRLRSLESHIDLANKGSESTQGNVSIQTELRFVVGWSNDNSVKFRFIGYILDLLQTRHLHVVVVIQKKNSQKLFHLMETYLSGKGVRFESPETGQRGDSSNPEGNETWVTLLSSTSNTISHPPDLVICLDGNSTASQIRQRTWAQNPNRPAVPLLHLVIPRTVGHIERYLSPNLDALRKSHTIVAALAQFHAQSEIGQAIDYRTPRTSAAASAVVDFLFPAEESSSLAEWPLPALGSVKDVIEFQTQYSQEAPTPISPHPSSISAGKRPLDDDRADSSKRMRFTPKPQGELDFSGDNGITHVSDSMPRTTADVPELLRKLDEVAKALSKECALRKEGERRFRTTEASWSNQQLVYEKNTEENLALKKKNEELTQKLEASEKREAQLRQRLEKNASDLLDRTKRHKDLEDVQLLSDDEKIVEITRLRKELADAKESEQRAIKNKNSTEGNFDYVKEQYRELQSQAASLREQLGEEQTKRQKAERKAAAPELLNEHRERQERLHNRKKDLDAAQVNILKQQLKVKEADIERLKASRGVGLGTRTQSVGPRSSKPASRAASPLPGNHRVTNLKYS